MTTDDHVIGEWCGPGGRHLPTVIYSRRPRDWFRVRYWVVCWECDLRHGPFLTRDGAECARRRIESA